MNSKFKKYFLISIKIIFSAALFVIVFLNIFKKETVDFVSIISYQLIFIIFLTGIIQVTINAFIQQKLLSIYDIDFSFCNILKHNFISTMYLLAIPGFFAPDIYLGYYYGKNREDFSRVLSTLIINRAIGFATIILLTITAFLILGKDFFFKIPLSNTQGFDIRIILIVVCGLLFLLMIWVLIKSKIRSLITKIIIIWHETYRKKRQIIAAFFMKLIFNISGLLGRVYIGYLAGIDIGIWEFASVILILNLLISLPLSINGIGIREVGYVGLLTVLGVPAGVAFIFALSEFAITLASSLIGAFIFLAIKIKIIKS